MADLAKTLAAGRVGLGLGMLAAPVPVAKALGLDVPGNPQSGLWARWFGTREVMLGAAVLMGGPGARSYAIKAGIGVDAGDALGAILEKNAGRLAAPQAFAGAVVALGAVGIGILALSE